MAEYDTYQSPFSWRYGSQTMRQIWSEVYKRRAWRRIWVNLARAEAEFGVLDAGILQELHDHINDIDLDRAHAIEAEIHHDLMAELQTFAEQCPTAGGSLHLGATSMDIEDNAEALRIRQSLELILEKLRELLLLLTERMSEWADTPMIAFTHLQPAEPSTVGYRLAFYAQDLLSDWDALSEVYTKVQGKGFKGAVGTGAAYGELVGTERLAEFEERLSILLDLPFYPIASQVYPRKQEYSILSALAGLGGSLYKFAFDLRFLQSPPIGEMSEPFGEHQVGSSAMPFKRNPIQAEKIDSLARWLAQMPRIAWDNAAHSLLERTLDDSANRRLILPEAFLASDELIHTGVRIFEKLQINQEAVQRNLSTYGPFAATERVLMALGSAGADRQAMHARLREHALTAWKAVQNGEDNPLQALICADPTFLEYASAEDLMRLMDVNGYIGFAADRTRDLAKTIQFRMN